MTMVATFLFVVSFTLCIARLGRGDPSFTPILPPSYPLAVRNPYLSAWLSGNQTANLPYAVPQFWNGQELTWSVMARVDGQTYSLFGVPDPLSGVEAGMPQSAEYTSTHTIFILTAGSARLVLDFFSPISPQDYVRQSLPFSYLTISASGLNGVIPSVQIYSDMDNSWIGQYGEDVQTDWGFATTEHDTQVLTLTPVGTATYSEVNDMAQWGTAIYCTREDSTNVAAQVGDESDVRSGFVANGTLTTGWSWQPGNVIAFSQDLGSVGSMKNVTFVIGYVREDAVNYMGNARTSYYRSTTPDINAACIHMLLDLGTADAESRTLDAAISSKANSIAGSNYSDILALSARQAFGALDITIPEGTLNTSDAMIFLKEISSSGNVNTIDVILPLSPILYVMAPEYIRLLLEPVMQYLATGAWPHNYTIHDIGFSYPNATGHNNGTAEQMPVEECGNVLLLAYMYQLASGNNEWATQYSSLFQKYANYLVTNGLHPTKQLSSDDGTGSVANQTGLAIKAAIALNAYGEMTGQANYSDIGRSFSNTLYNDKAGTNPARTHFTLMMNKDKSWGMEYNLYLDILLELNTFPAAAYAMQTNYYRQVRAQDGVALDSKLDWGKTDWMHFAAAIAMSTGVNSNGIRNILIDDVHMFLTNGQNDVPFSDNFFVENNGSDVAGAYNTYRARPVVGGHFALMALNGPNQIQVGAGQSKKRSERSESWPMRLWARLFGT